MKDIRVLKFGGTSMGDARTWIRVLEITEGYSRPVIVVSATAHTTRKLLAAAQSAVDDTTHAKEIGAIIRSRHELLLERFLRRCDEPIDAIRKQGLQTIDRLIGELHEGIAQIAEAGSLTPAMQDRVVSIGEQLSSRLLALCGQAMGLPTVLVDARDVIKTDSDFGQARPDEERIQKEVKILSALIEDNKIPVIGGFYGEDSRGAITTLGFEGSDYTASLLGRALECDAVEIWTDVNGIFTCDPNRIEEAVSIPEISFREATEMAYFGARVLHPSTLRPVAEVNIPVFVRNIFNSDHPGTKIHAEGAADRPCRALTFLEQIVVITVTAPSTLMGYRFLRRVFQALERHHLPVDLVSTTEASVTIALEQSEHVTAILEELEQLGEVNVSRDHSLISLIGFTLSGMQTITEKVFIPLEDNLSSLFTYNREKKNLHLVVPQERMLNTARTLHRSLIWNPSENGS